MGIKKNKGISRIDSKVCRTYGWYVRVRFNGKIVSKMFSDLKYGGRAKALMKARRFYKKTMRKLVKRHTDFNTDKIPIKTIISRNDRNNTGVVGVQKIVRQKKDGTLYQAYRANWTETDGKSKTKFFSVEKYGDRQAFKLACELRKAKLLEFYYGDQY